jgi:flavin-binding protein dodecin
MADTVFKKIELVGTSPDGFDAAVSNAVAKAGESIHGISWFEVVELRGSVAEGKVKQFQATVRIGFKVD